MKLLDLMAEKDDQSSIREAITSFDPEIIGISVRNVDDQNMENPRFLLDQVKKVVTDCRNLSGVPIVLGGAGYSIFPESALSYLEADMGIQGEGETSFPFLLDRLARGEDLSDAPGLYLRGSGLQVKESLRRTLIYFRFPVPLFHLFVLLTNRNSGRRYRQGVDVQWLVAIVPLRSSKAARSERGCRI